MSICSILSSLKWSDQGCVDDLPQVYEAGSCQCAEDVAQHQHERNPNTNREHDPSPHLLHGEALIAMTEENAPLLTCLLTNGK